jgi:uncharacterized protein YndB with AHSA1/START domain
MKFSTKDDIEAPAAFVFAQISDFAALERQAMRRGASVRRIDQLPVPGAGSVWDVVFPFRGKDREVRIEIVAVQAPDRIDFKAKSGGLDIVSALTLVALSRRQTRLSLDSELVPGSLTARLLVQSLKLARGTVTAKIQARMTGYAKDIRSRYVKDKAG